MSQDFYISTSYPAVENVHAKAMWPSLFIIYFPSRFFRRDCEINSPSGSHGTSPLSHVRRVVHSDDQNMAWHLPCFVRQFDELCQGEERSVRVLVIEDEPNIRRLLREILEESGYCVDVAVDGHEGLSKAVTWPYDAVILDLLLPQMDGWELLESLRETHNTPVLILSARDALSDRVLGLDLGADDYLSKPFERVELLARLRALIRRSAGQSQSTISLEDLVVDLRGRRVLRDEVDLQLTAREFSVLEYLVLHRGRVVSRNEITDHLLDESDNSISNSLDVHISNLRKKLGRDVIATRRGQGYVVTQ